MPQDLSTLIANLSPEERAAVEEFIRFLQEKQQPSITFQAGQALNDIADHRTAKNSWVAHACGVCKRGTALRVLRPCRRAAFR